MAASGNSERTCKWVKNDRLNKEHTEKLAALYELQETEPDKVVPDLKICVCPEEKFQIGKGREGTLIYVGLVRRDGREVAVKKVIKDLYKRVENEVDVLVGLRKHPNIVDYLMVEEDRLHNYSYIATELCDFTIEQWINQPEVKAMDEKDWSKKASALLEGFLSGLDHMHTLKPHSIVHRDLKPQDVFVTDQGCIKIADFGLSVPIEPGHSYGRRSDSGVDSWKPREVLDQMYKKKSADEKLFIEYRISGDIQSAGMVCFYIISRGTHPYEPYEEDDAYDLIHHNVKKGRYNLSKVEDPVACDLVEKMLAHEPEDRLPAGELLRHAYFWNDEKRYKFLAAIGDQKEVATYDPSNHPQNDTVREIERADVLPTLPTGQKDWGSLSVMAVLGPQFQVKPKDLWRRASVCHLLRALRNIQEHYGEQSEGAKKILGYTCYPYAYFNAELPQLFIKMYQISRSTAGTRDDWLQRDKLKNV